MVGDIDLKRVFGVQLLVCAVASDGLHAMEVRLVCILDMSA